MMKLVKRSNSKSSSKKKFLNNRTMDNDPFLLLAEVAGVSHHVCIKDKNVRKFYNCTDKTDKSRCIPNITNE